MTFMVQKVTVNRRTIIHAEKLKFKKTWTGDMCAINTFLANETCD